MTALAQALPQSPGSASAGPPVFPASDAPVPVADPDMQEVLDAQEKLGAKPVQALTPAEARRQPSPADAVKEVLKQRGLSTAPDPAVVTRTLSYGAEPLQKVLLYRPSAPASGRALPLIVYYHGGGWVIADLQTYDATPRMLAKELNAVVVSVEYRHAPEVKFPGQHEDAIAAYKWALEQAEGWGADADRVILAGESAGANLAVATAIYARDHGVMMPVHLLAVYPIANSDPELPAKLENANAKPLNTAMLSWFAWYFSAGEATVQDPRINLVGADLRHLPPTTIVNAQIDPLRSDGETLAEVMRAAGSDVEQRTFPGVTHEFFGMKAVVKGAAEASAYAVQRLRTALDRTEMGSARQ